LSRIIFSFTAIAFLSVLLLVPGGSISFSEPPSNQINSNNKSAPQIIPNSYIVVLNDDVSHPSDVANEMAHKHGLKISHVYSHAIKGYSAVIPDSQLSKVMSDDRVNHIDEDQVLSISAPGGKKGKPTDGGGEVVGPDSQKVPTGINRINAGKIANLEEGSVGVAVIDTGISNHSDLNIVGGYNCQKGKPDRYSDGNGHGTHVAGTIAAKNNTIGVVGVAPGADLYAVKVLNSAGSGTWSSVICGIDWVTANNSIIDVANMSLGGGGSDGACNSNAMHQAICNAVDAGVTFVVASGNSANDAANHVPAAYDQVITVSALADFDGESGGNGSPTCRSDDDDTFANFSNYGADIDIIAPGVCIESTWNDGGYNTISGTSMASPHVAGAAALYISQNPNPNPTAFPSTYPQTVQSALESKGNYVWDNTDDGDGTQEPLVDVTTLQN
jgi:subtilisin family serine protease